MKKLTKPFAELRTRGDRLQHAVELEGTSLQAAELAAGFSRGALSRYARGQRGGTTVDVDKMKALADHLHVRVEWLLWNEGPVRREGRGTTPAEEAIVFCRRAGIREEAIQAAWERFRDRETSMTAAEWVATIQAEGAVFDRTIAQRHKPIETTALPARVDRPLLPPAKPRREPKPRNDGR